VLQSGSLVLPLLGYLHSRNEIEASPQTQALYSKLLEKVLDILDITPQEVECAGVIVLYGLRDVDDAEMTTVKENIVFGKIGMNEFASVIHLPDIENELFV
jgi:hypothetical protein